MNREIFKPEENESISEPTEQITEQEAKADQEKPEQKKEDELLEQEQAKEEIDEAREKLSEKYKEQKADSEEQEKIDAREFFGKAKGREEDIKLSLVGKVSENISNIKSSQEVRDKTAERKMPEIIKALGEIGDNLENIKNNIKTILSLGAGWGENLRDLSKELEAEKVVGIDINTVASKKVREEVGDKLAWIKGDALEEIKHLEDGSFSLSELTAYLQVLSREDKIKILREVGRVSELVVVVDELKRDGMNGFRDLFMNKLYNAGMGRYEILREEEWKEIFKEASLVAIKEVFNNFGKNDFVAVLKKAEEKVGE